MPTAPFSAAIMLVRYGYSFLLIAGKVLEDILNSKILVLFNLLFNHEKYDNDDDESAKTCRQQGNSHHITIAKATNST